MEEKDAIGRLHKTSPEELSLVRRGEQQIIGESPEGQIRHYAANKKLKNYLQLIGIELLQLLKE
jgi:hypothetical protein